MINSSENKFIGVFKNNLKKDARTVSIATLLSHRYLNRIKYDPYYQRNYVWEKDKQSFFIESIILGTEIPPIVLYKSGLNIEVIDGRQRFETIKRFKEDDFALHSSGLIELKALEGKKYSSLKPEFQKLFEDTKIRIFEFEVVGYPNVEPNIEDRIKKEIFRRYNSGITPLSQSEVDNAKYDEDKLTGYFRSCLKNDKNFYHLLKECFFKSTSDSDLIVPMTSKIRTLLVLNRIPISRFAYTGKTSIIELLYDNFISTVNDDEISEIVEKMKNNLQSIYSILPNENSNVYECIYWALSVLDQENIHCVLYNHKDDIIRHYRSNSVYYVDNSHYYSNVIARFEDSGNFFKKLYKFDFKDYIRSNTFNKKVQAISQTEEDVDITMEKLASLRINKPSPASKPIDQIMRELEANKYLIRPSYQRSEKINIHKASSIIESILLGIKLPPLFIYVRNDGIREVVDGQQRLLTILAFLGHRYKNEDGDYVTSKNHCFRLKDLRIKTEFNGKNFSDIQSKVEDLILDFDLDEIEIQEDLNPKFEPTDLFIRLNNKPYPIHPNTFEMWNSIADNDIIQKIKNVFLEFSNWFYIQQTKFDESGKRKDRMRNEELITILSFLCYNNYKTGDPQKILGFYPRMKTFTCRLKTKSQLTDLLESLADKPIEKDNFICAIEKTKEIIEIFRDILIDGEASKDSFNKILNVKDIPNFSRTYQEFYVIWILMMNVNREQIERFRDEFIIDLTKVLKLQKNVDGLEVNDAYVASFLRQIQQIQEKYNTKDITSEE